ncbi:MAG: nuclear transport factor 2 family protein [Alphaproteobacteria bacterium]
MTETLEKNAGSRASTAQWRQARIIELLDDALTGRDVARVKSFITPDCEIVFPGFSGTGHAGVDDMYRMIDQLFTSVPTKSFDLWIHGETAVNVHGKLFGQMTDGPSIDNARYTDTFVFDADGRISEWRVFNDVALLLLK